MNWELVRPAVYQAVRRGAIALAVVLLRVRFVVKNAPNSLCNGCFAAGVVFFALAWAYFLKLDGLSFNFEGWTKKRENKKKIHFSKDIADFVDEHITDLDELSDHDRIACSLASSLGLGIVFWIAAFAAMLLGK